MLRGPHAIPVSTREPASGLRKLLQCVGGVQAGI